MLIAVICALASALVHAIATVVQQRTAAAVPMREGGELRLIWRLLRTPRWLLAKGGDFIGLIFQAIALRQGGLIVVQAIATSTVLMALLISAAQDHRRIDRTELFGGLGIVVGLAMLIGGGEPKGERPAGLVAWILVIVVVALAAGGAAAMARRSASEHGAGWWAMAAGLVFGVDAVCLKRAVDVWDGNHVHAVGWAVGFVALSLLGNIALARAFQSGPLRSSLPIFTAVTPVAALALGPLLFHEHLHTGPRLVIALVGAAITIAAGIVCARSEADHAPSTPPSPAP